MASAYRINSIYSQWESRPTIDLWSTTTEGIGRNANGTDYWRGGLTWVGERGPELIQLPQATRIFSTEESAGISSRMAAMQMMSTTYGGDTFVFHPGAIVIDPKNVREFNDVVRMAQDARQSQRAGRR